MKRLPFLTKSQRRALLVLEWLLLLIIIGLAIKTSSNSPERESSQSVPLRGSSDESLPQEQPFETFPFDPNTADSTTLLRLGLSPWQVRSVYRYRAKHGRYHVPEDFMRLPGMTNEQWERLKPCIRIGKKFQYVAPHQTSPRGGRLPSPPVPHVANAGEGQTPTVTVPRDSVPRREKLAPGQTIDINTADTTLLKKIPGIASKRAARIVAYRTALGGFVTVEQAMEATEMPDSVLKYMTLSPQPVQKINVNKLSVQHLMRHPYINFYQAKAINEYRRNRGELHSVEDLSRLEAFRPTDIDRLRPYLEF